MDFKQFGSLIRLVYKKAYEDGVKFGVNVPQLAHVSVPGEIAAEWYEGLDGGTAEVVWPIFREMFSFESSDGK